MHWLRRSVQQYQQPDTRDSARPQRAVRSPSRGR